MELIYLQIPQVDSVRMGPADTPGLAVREGNGREASL